LIEQLGGRERERERERGKMFRLHRNRQAKSGEKIDFKFSNFKALQVHVLMLPVLF